MKLISRIFFVKLISRIFLVKLISRMFFVERIIFHSILCFPDQLEYVPDLNYLEEVKGFISGKKTEIRLVDQRNYTYGVDKKDFNNKIWWVCTRAHHQCKSQAITIGNTITKFSGQHSHEPTYNDDFKLLM